MFIPILRSEALEFIAKYFGDLSKAVITVGFASHFFKEMPVYLRIGCFVTAIVLFVIGVIIIERKGEQS